MPTCTFNNATLPTIIAEYCDPEIHLGQIRRVLFTKPGQGLTNSTSLVEWNTRLSNSAAATGSPPPIRYLNVIGQMPKPEVSEKVISLDRTVLLKQTNNVTFRVDETDLENVNLARAIQGVSVAKYQVWLETEDRLIGGDDGFEAEMKLYHVIPESFDDVQYLEGSLRWFGAQPEVAASPFV